MSRPKAYHSILDCVLQDLRARSAWRRYVPYYLILEDWLLLMDELQLICRNEGEPFIHTTREDVHLTHYLIMGAPIVPTEVAINVS